MQNGQMHRLQITKNSRKTRTRSYHSEFRIQNGTRLKRKNGIEWNCTKSMVACDKSEKKIAWNLKRKENTFDSILFTWLTLSFAKTITMCGTGNRNGNENLEKCSIKNTKIGFLFKNSNIQNTHTRIHLSQFGIIVCRRTWVVHLVWNIIWTLHCLLQCVIEFGKQLRALRRNRIGLCQPKFDLWKFSVFQWMKCHRVVHG